MLYPAPVRDLMLSLARNGLYHARWTGRIQDEWVRNLLSQRPDIGQAQLRRTCDLMSAAVPDCLIEGWEALEGGLRLPDPDDRHVLAAAICGHADAIVTYNLKDFPEEALAPFGLEAQHPDDFILNQIDLNEIAALTAVKAMRARLRNPPVSAAQLIETLEKSGLPACAARLRGAAELF